MKTLIYTICFWFHFAPIVLYAQAYTKIFGQALGTEMGLSQSSALCIWQDSYGLMWFGTRDGLNLYDGAKFTTFRNQPSVPNSIAGNLINDITKANENDLWIAHNKGISLYQRQSGQFKNYSIEANNAEIRSIIVADNIWACGWEGLFVFDAALDTFVKYRPKNTNTSLISAKLVQSLTKNGYWIATTYDGLCFLDKSGNIRKIFTGDNANIRIEDIVIHPNGNLYVGTYGGGLLECDAEGQILRRWNKQNTHNTYSIDNIRSLSLDRSGLLWIGGFQGMATLDPHTGMMQRLTPIHGIFEIGDVSVRAHFVDNNGSMWVGSYHNGVFLFDSYFTRFSITPLLTENRTQLRGIVSAFASAVDGRYYVATENGYLLEYDPSGSIVRNHLLRTTDQEQQLVIKSLYYDNLLNQLWIGTLSDGLFIKNTRNVKEMPKEASDQQPLDLGVINTILPKDEDHLWLLTDKAGGLQLINRRTAQIISFPSQTKINTQIGRGTGRYIAKIKGNSYLLATRGAGLLFFDNTDIGEVKRVLTEVSDVNHVSVDENHIYVSTHGYGLYILNHAFQVLKCYTTDNGLANNIVLSAQKDTRDNLWVCTYNGVHRIRPDGTISNYNIKNGLHIAEINSWGHHISDGYTQRFFAGGKDLWVSFDPNNLKENTYVPTTYITSVILNDSTIRDIAFLNPTQHNADSTIKLDSDESQLTIEFAATNFIMSQNNRFRYMMEGYDETWIYTDSPGFARYNKLPGGKYTFKVQASNNDGIWSKNTAALTIHKLPPLWLSWKAFVLYALILGALFYYFRKNEIRKIKLRQKIKFEEEEKRRIAEVHDLKIKHFNDISHEIRTPLTLILQPMDELMGNQVLSSKEKRAIRSMQHHGKNLLLLVNQLLEINRIEIKKERLKTTPTYLKELLSIIDHSFRPIAEDANIHWIVDTSKTTKTPVLIDRTQIEKVFLNLLSNAFKFTPKEGAIRLIVTTREKNGRYELIAEVTDNGVGIAEQDLPHIFNRFYKGEHQNNVIGSGIGLALVKAIVEELMDGQITVKSKEQEGTSFTFIIPNIEAAPQHIAGDHGESPLISTYRNAMIEEDTSSSHVADTGSEKKNLLLVEDNASLLTMLTERLGQYYNIVGKASAEEALAHVEHAEIDLIISDVMLPGMSGKDLCAAVKSNIITSHIPFILLTAVDEEESKLEGLELGADDYVTKPFVFRELLLRINNILSQRVVWQDYIKNKKGDAKSKVRFNKHDEELIKNIDNILLQRLEDTDYTIEELSKDVGLSRVHLFRKLKAITGLSPSQYIRDFKLDKAVEILNSEYIRNTELAYRVGFQDPNYFLKCFKHRFGKTPSAYGK